MEDISYHDIPPSFVDLPDGELLGRIDGCKNRIRLSRNDFARDLPECARRGLHRRRGCGSLQQFAAIRAPDGCTDWRRRLKRCGAPRRGGSMGIEIAAMDQLQQTILFPEEPTGLLFGRSPRGQFLTAAALYGKAWNDRMETSYEEEYRACEHLLRSRESAGKANGGSSPQDARLPGETPQCNFAGGDPPEGAPSRQLPRRVRRFLQPACDGRCTFPGCHMPVHSIHHARRWALIHVHELHALHPLCKEHDALVHGAGVIDEEGPTEGWKIAGPRRFDEAATEDVRTGRSNGSASSHGRGKASERRHGQRKRRKVDPRLAMKSLRKHPPLASPSMWG